MSSLGEDQAHLLRVLARHGVEMVVVGGVAAQIRGWRGATADLDITIATTDDNVRRLNDALAELDAGPPAIGQFGSVFQTRFGRLEIVRRAHGIGEYDDWARGADEIAVTDQIAVVVADAADVVRSKQAAGREKDLEALPQLRRDLLDAGALREADIDGPVARAGRSERAEPPSFLIDLLGPRPASNPGRWDIAAQSILDYRDRWGVAGPGLGDEELDRPGQARDRERIEALIRRSSGR